MLPSLVFMLFGFIVIKFLNIMDRLSRVAMHLSQWQKIIWLAQG